MGLIKTTTEFVEQGYFRKCLLKLGVKLDEIKLIDYIDGVYTYRVESEVEAIPKGDTYFSIEVTIHNKYEGVDNRDREETSVRVKIERQD